MFGISVNRVYVATIEYEGDFIVVAGHLRRAIILRNTVTTTNSKTAKTRRAAEGKERRAAPSDTYRGARTTAGADTVA